MDADLRRVRDSSDEAQNRQSRASHLEYHP
jgi:hypothetical protein